MPKKLVNTDKLVVFETLINVQVFVEDIKTVTRLVGQRTDHPMTGLLSYSADMLSTQKLHSAMG